MQFHEVRFPTDIALGATATLRRQTDIIVLGSGHEERNTRWQDSRRSYNAGYGIHTLDDLYAVIDFFEERRGPLYGFRWKDGLDYRSGPPGQPVSPLDQEIGTGDGVSNVFALVKQYGQQFARWQRPVQKPVAGTVVLAVNGVEVPAGTGWTLDETTGQVTFQVGQIPAAGAVITAGFEFDVPVRFDTDRLEISLAAFQAGQIPDIPLIEVRL